MAKAIRVIKQMVVKVPRKTGGFNKVFFDVVELDDGWFAFRNYQTSKAKVSHSQAYGVTKSRRHVGERITGGSETAYRSYEDAFFHMRSELEAEQLRVSDTLTSEVKNPKLFNH